MWDGYWSTCLAWLSTAMPDEYNMVGQVNGTDVIRTPCEHYSTKSSAFPTTTLPRPPTSGASGAQPVSTSAAFSLKVAIVGDVSRTHVRDAPDKD